MPDGTRKAEAMVDHAYPGQTLLDRCKPSTQKTAAWILKAHLLPAFGSLPLDRITRTGVNHWFDEYSRTAPGGANSAMNLLRRILNKARYDGIFVLMQDCKFRLRGIASLRQRYWCIRKD